MDDARPQIFIDPGIHSARAVFRRENFYYEQRRFCNNPARGLCAANNGHVGDAVAGRRDPRPDFNQRILS